VSSISAAWWGVGAATQAVPIEIDDDVRVEYWTEIRELPDKQAKTTTA